MAELRMPKINIVMLSGRLTREPEFKAVGSKMTALAKLSIAVDNSFQKNGEWVNEAYYFDVECWGKAADKAQDLHKGDPVIIDGSLKYHSWNDENMQKKSAVSIVAYKFHHLSKSNDRIDGIPTADVPGKEITDVPF